MLAFAGNSLLCRMALLHTGIDAATFTSVRLISGALVLWLIAAQRSGPGTKSLGGGWLSAVALFVYAEAFSFAYLSLPAGTGALLLFAAVQMSMIGWGLYRGERLARWQVAGFALAVGGLVFLLLPGLSAPPLQGALLMTAAGVAWAVYSLRAKGAGDPTRANLFSMWVAPEARGSGAGTALVAAGVDCVRACDVRILRTAVTVGNDAAARLYARAGFADTGTREPLGHSDAEVRILELTL